MAFSVARVRDLLSRLSSASTFPVDCVTDLSAGGSAQKTDVTQSEAKITRGILIESVLPESTPHVYSWIEQTLPPCTKTSVRGFLCGSCASARFIQIGPPLHAATSQQRCTRYAECPYKSIDCEAPSDSNPIDQGLQSS